VRFRKKFSQWYVTINITGFLDFVQHLALSKEHVSGSVSVLRWKGGECLHSCIQKKEITYSKTTVFWDVVPCNLVEIY
jgi:hypothetical protein